MVRLASTCFLATRATTRLRARGSHEQADNKGNEAVTAPISRHLRTTLDTQLGTEAADELLNLMPPDWTQLATKHDLAILGTELRGEMAELRGEVRSEISELRSEMHREFRKQTTLMMASMFTLVGIMTGLTSLLATLD
jgi:hypothetical protein